MVVSKKSNNNKKIKPFISVITIVFNDVENIERTIKSVVEQSYKNFEYIIIDGGSTDGTLDIIKKYDSKIDHWVSEKDGGIYPAMNKGIKFANGEILNFMNSGDFYKNNNILNWVTKKFEEDDKISYVLGLGMFLDENNKEVKKGGKRYTTTLKASRFSSICHQAFFYKKSLHNYFGCYDLRYKICADGHFMYRVYRNKEVKGVLVNKIFAVRDREGVSRSGKSILEHKKMYDEVFGRSLLNELFYLKYLLKKTSLGCYLHEKYLSIKEFIIKSKKYK
jgi:glycosyltransferase involved in cell wall biosynthesis